MEQSCCGQGYGELILMDALKRAWQASRQVASFAMIVDVLDVQPDPLPFYLRYDFVALPNEPRRLFLPFQNCDPLLSDGPSRPLGE